MYVDGNIGGSVDGTEARNGGVIAFARNPMTVAVAANDLQAFSSGRFVLGLGSLRHDARQRLVATVRSG